jgi:dipeptidyl aminopeptidase/acylaminoacyl peptidase
VAYEGVSDLISFYGQMQMGAVGTPRAWGETENGGQFRIGTTPWENRDGYINNSPIFFADRISTPLLLVHGEQDDNVSITQSDEMYLALRRLGKPVEYLRYRQGSHNPLYDDYTTLLDYTTRVVEWFDSHLRAAAPVSPSP